MCLLDVTYCGAAVCQLFPEKQEALAPMVPVKCAAGLALLSSKQKWQPEATVVHDSRFTAVPGTTLQHPLHVYHASAEVTVQQDALPSALHPVAALLV